MRRIDIRDPNLFIVRCINSHSVNAWLGVAMTPVANATNQQQPLTPVIQFEFVEDSLRLGVILALS